jgi:hypothetical protein
MQTDREILAEMTEQAKGNAVLEEKLRSFDINTVKRVAESASPRFIKTHLPFSLLPTNLMSTCKVRTIKEIQRNEIVLQK